MKNVSKYHYIWNVVLLVTVFRTSGAKAADFRFQGLDLSTPIFTPNTFESCLVTTMSCVTANQFQFRNPQGGGRGNNLSFLARATGQARRGAKEGNTIARHRARGIIPISCNIALTGTALRRKLLAEGCGGCWQSLSSDQVMHKTAAARPHESSEGCCVRSRGIRDLKRRNQENWNT